MRVYYRPTRNYREHPGGEEEEEEGGKACLSHSISPNPPAPPCRRQREPLAREPHGKVEPKKKELIVPRFYLPNPITIVDSVEAANQRCKRSLLPMQLGAMARRDGETSTPVIIITL